MTLYKVTNWERYETHETRKLENLRWVPTPNKHDGLGFRRMVSQEDRTDLFAGWNLILQLASKGPRDRRGRLERGGIALNADDMSIMTGFPAKVFERALTFFSDKQIGWLEVEKAQQTDTSPGRTGLDPGQAGTDSGRTGLNPAEGRKEGRKEGLETKAHSPAPDPENGKAERGEEREVELPHNFPKTLQEALTIADMCCVTDEVAEKAWNKAMSRGGRDSKDIPIRNFRSYLATEASYARARMAQAASEHKTGSTEPPVTPQRPPEPKKMDPEAVKAAFQRIKDAIYDA